MRVGILGGGQLARMLALAGIPMGMRFAFFDPAKDPCAKELGEHFCGAYNDEALLKKFAESVDVVTYEFENVSLASVELLQKVRDVFPGPKALEVTQDRWREKTFFQYLGIGTSQFLKVNSFEDVERAASELGFPFVLKSRSGGYDGKGQVVVRTKEELASAWDKTSKVHWIAEAWVPFDREVSMVACRSVSGQTAFYDLAENVHYQGILQKSINRPGDSISEKAKEYTRQALDELEYVGTIAVEYFQVGEKLLANEYAPRVHNSGHWTIEGAKTSQFENHLRAILDLPLGDTGSLGSSSMLNFVGTIPELGFALDEADVHFHDYGKSPRPGRKLGHLTIRGEDSLNVEEKVERVFKDVEWVLR